MFWATLYCNHRYRMPILGPQFSPCSEFCMCKAVLNKLLYLEIYSVQNGGIWRWQSNIWNHRHWWPIIIHLQMERLGVEPALYFSHYLWNDLHQWSGYDNHLHSKICQKRQTNQHNDLGGSGISFIQSKLNKWFGNNFGIWCTYIIQDRLECKYLISKKNVKKQGFYLSDMSIVYKFGFVSHQNLVTCYKNPNIENVRKQLLLDWPIIAFL